MPRRGPRRGPRPDDWKIQALSATAYAKAEGIRHPIEHKKCTEAHWIGRAIESEMTWENTGRGTWWWIWYKGDQCQLKCRDTVSVEDTDWEIMEIYFWKNYKRGCIKLK